jgi:hypothetical protein
MFILYQTLGAIITLGYIVGAPLLIGLIVALARGAARRSVIVLASVATALVFVGVVSADAITGLLKALSMSRWRTLFWRQGFRSTSPLWS